MTENNSIAYFGKTTKRSAVEGPPGIKSWRKECFYPNKEVSSGSILNTGAAIAKSAIALGKDNMVHSKSLYGRFRDTSKRGANTYNCFNILPRNHK